MRKLLPVLLSAALAVLSLTSCSTVEQPMGTSRGYQSARFVETQRAQRPASPGALEDDPEFNAAVRSSIARKFSSQGIPVTQGSADLIIAYMLLRQNSVATTMNSDYFGRGRDAMAILDEAHKRGVVVNRSPDDFLRGAVLIDVLDARTNKLVFRNIAVRPVTEGVAPAVRQQRLDAAVAEALQPFFKN